MVLPSFCARKQKCLVVLSLYRFYSLLLSAHFTLLTSYFLLTVTTPFYLLRHFDYLPCSLCQWLPFPFSKSLEPSLTTPLFSLLSRRVVLRDPSVEVPSLNHYNLIASHMAFTLVAIYSHIKPSISSLLSP